MFVFRFPLKDPQRSSRWIKQMHIADWTPTTNTRLCSKHFESHFFYKIGNKTCLVDDAVPTIFLELPKYLQPTEQPRRVCYIHFVIS